MISTDLQYSYLWPILKGLDLSEDEKMQALIETEGPKRRSIRNIVILTGLPVVAAIAASLYVANSGFHLVDLVPFFVMYFLTGLAITAGYHRFYSHRAFDCHPVIQFFFLLFGAAAIENAAYYWVSDHRFHHKHEDTNADPYNIKKGFWWAHIGWIFWDDAPGARQYANIPDLKKDALVQWQRKYYVAIAVLVGLGLPFLIGLAFGRPWGGLIWGGLVRTVFVQHCTFLINSAAHWFGGKTYSERVTARDNWWLAFFSYGEGYHNFHHAFPSDYRNGLRWYHWDPTKWLIRGLNFLGLSDKLRRTPDETIRTAIEKTRQTQTGIGSLSPITAATAGVVVSAAAVISAEVAQNVTN